ncbi:MAG: hypothetical protein LBR25_03060, partial [Erysipelotrichaceae bacterium]|nr:hypothetical protein [Erysipelotrichaceae bacterium]
FSEDHYYILGTDIINGLSRGYVFDIDVLNPDNSKAKLFGDGLIVNSVTMVKEINDRFVVIVKGAEIDFWTSSIKTNGSLGYKYQYYVIFLDKNINILYKLKLDEYIERVMDINKFDDGFVLLIDIIYGMPLYDFQNTFDSDYAIVFFTSDQEQ